MDHITFRAVVNLLKAKGLLLEDEIVEEIKRVNAAMKDGNIKEAQDLSKVKYVELPFEKTPLIFRV